MSCYLEGPSRDKRNHQRDLFSAKQLYPYFTGKDLAETAGADVWSNIAKRQDDGVSAATINKEMGLVRAAINWARKEHEWDIPNPFECRKLKEPAGRSRWLSQTEAAMLIRAAKQVPKAAHLADFIRLGLYSGMRPGEMLGLEWSRVDLSRNLV
ncbi:site-specific integrase [Methylococcus mesophilus]|uniref:site-specific integrase n=1 Tax=Methylococcus mesophilus TaxID=2993564 RepID=UPI00224B2A04|nr:hypothetical protein [Methylococcus mesophilus]UZR27741.1 hypothetical protein OOT43_13515 [Methylococcus mesophilus]